MSGLNLLKRAIELDPGYARARSLLAWAFATRVVLGNMDFERGISDGLVLAQRAIDLDPDDPWAHLAAGYVYTFSRTIWAGGRRVERSACSAIRISPLRGSFLASPTAMPGWRRKVTASLRSQRD